MAFLPHTDADKKDMLKAIGVENFEDLLSDLPAHLLYKGELKLPAPMSEMEVTSHLRRLSQKNENCLDNVSFLGGGAYDHFIPAVVKHILLRSEFYTAYTPYQPEVSQGTLQAIYEYQSLICELTGMDVANASMYDGGSALAEAALLACSFTRRSKVVVSAACHPNYIKIIRTYCYGQGIDVTIIPWDEGTVNVDALSESVDDRTAAVIVQHPNFFGCLEDMPALSELSHKAGALFITSNDPISLSVLQPPGEYGADIATGEGQPLGTPLSLGGPYLGIFAATEKLMRRMPGRIVGRTRDSHARQGFVLTLQTREQHIRREKATSNICTNNGLNALAATVYMALLGKSGMRKIAELCLQKAGYFANKIRSLDGFSLKFPRPFFKEFVVQSDSSVDGIISVLAQKGFFAGVPLMNYDHSLEDCFLTCVTEKRTKAEMDRFVQLLAEQK